MRAFSSQPVFSENRPIQICVWTFLDGIANYATAQDPINPSTTIPTGRCVRIYIKRVLYCYHTMEMIQNATPQDLQINPVF